jgi:hypothetical protein
VSMRRVREILRLKHEGGASDRQIGRSLGLARRTRPTSCRSGPPASRCSG